jgi:hypothetical protein
VKASRFAGPRRSRPPLALRQHPVLLVILDLAQAVLADVDGTLRLPLGPADLRELENLRLVAQRTGHPVVALVAVFKARLDAAAARDLGSRDHEDLAARERAGPSQGQVYWVAFAVHIAGIGVHFIEEQIAGRHRAQPDRTVRSRHDQDAARKFFRQHRIPGVAGARIAHQFPQHRAFLNQRVDALLRIPLRHFDRWLN